MRKYYREKYEKRSIYFILKETSLKGGCKEKEKSLASGISS